MNDAYKEEERQLYYSTRIGSSDAISIATGKITNMMREKFFLKDPDDLSDVLPVQLGILTESFHLDWLRKKLNKDKDIFVPQIMNEQEHFKRDQGRLVSTVDAVYSSYIIEVKHTNERNTLDKAMAYYYPQLQHHMMVSGKEEIIFSCIFGNASHDYCTVYRDSSFIETYYARCKDILDLIENFQTDDWFKQEMMDDEEFSRALPVWTKDNINKKLKIATDKGVIYNLDERKDEAFGNEFNNLSYDYKVEHQTAKESEDRRKQTAEALKELVPDDAKSVTCNGVVVSRNKRNDLSIRLKG